MTQTTILELYSRETNEYVHPNTCTEYSPLNYLQQYKTENNSFFPQHIKPGAETLFLKVISSAHL